LVVTQNRTTLDIGFQFSTNGRPWPHREREHIPQ
jgi:hypothetical protein